MVGALDMIKEDSKGRAVPMSPAVSTCSTQAPDDADEAIEMLPEAHDSLPEPTSSTERLTFEWDECSLRSRTLSDLSDFTSRSRMQSSMSASSMHERCTKGERVEDHVWRVELNWRSAGACLLAAAAGSFLATAALMVAMVALVLMSVVLAVAGLRQCMVGQEEDTEPARKVLSDEAGEAMSLSTRLCIGVAAVSGTLFVAAPWLLLFC